MNVQWSSHNACYTLLAQWETIIMYGMFICIWQWQLLYTITLMTSIFSHARARMLMATGTSTARPVGPWSIPCVSTLKHMLQVICVLCRYLQLCTYCMTYLTIYYCLLTWIPFHSCSFSTALLIAIMWHHKRVGTLNTPYSITCMHIHKRTSVLQSKHSCGLDH